MEWGNLKTNVLSNFQSYAITANPVDKENFNC